MVKVAIGGSAICLNTEADSVTTVMLVSFSNFTIFVAVSPNP